MSINGCLNYILNERGIEPKKDPQSVKLDIDHKLEELREKREGEEIILRGINICKSVNKQDDKKMRFNSPE